MAAETLSVTERSWRAMGSDAHLIVVGSTNDVVDGLAERAVVRIEELEARWSRFRPTSEVCRLNELAGSAVEVSADTVTLVTLAVEAWRLTGGGFDPTMLAAVVEAGYDHDIDDIRNKPAALVPRGRSAHPAGRALGSLVACTDIEVNGRTVVLPEHTSFDAGGIGKGLAADLVLHELMTAGAAGACVNLGGDLRVAGTSPAGSTWILSIDHPEVNAPLALVGLDGGAIATSTTLLRRWTVDGEPKHHLIDPSTGEPSASDITFATVIAAETWEAEVLAKAVLLRGTKRAFDLLVPGRHFALIVDRDGVITTSNGFDSFIDEPVATHLPTSGRANSRNHREVRS